MKPDNKIQDIAPPQSNSQSQITPTELIQAEIEHSIPVKQPDQPGAAKKESNPIDSGKQFVESDNKNDKGLDSVLKDVNKKVKEEKLDTKPKKYLKLKLFAKKVNANLKPDLNTNQNNIKTHKPILLTAVAFFVAGVLSTAAFYAFKDSTHKTSTQTNSANSGQVGTSSESSAAVQAAGGALVTPDDIKDFTNSMDSELSKLSDAQDFNSSDLSDKNLGL